jgi:cardiolipin synthase (CMP-forming)
VSTPAPRAGAGDVLTVPNAVSLLRLVLVVPIVILVVQDADPVLTLVLLVVFGASDGVDGFLARRLGQASDLGARLDAVADRIGVGVIAIALAVAGLLDLWVVLLVAATDLAILASYGIARSVQRVPVTVLGKIRTAILMTALALIVAGRVPELALLGDIGRVLSWAGAVLHAAAGVGYIVVILRRRAAERAAGGGR